MIKRNDERPGAFHAPYFSYVARSRIVIHSGRFGQSAIGGTERAIWCAQSTRAAPNRRFHRRNRFEASRNRLFSLRNACFGPRNGRKVHRVAFWTCATVSSARAIAFSISATPALVRAIAMNCTQSPFGRAQSSRSLAQSPVRFAQRPLRHVQSLRETCNRRFGRRNCLLIKNLRPILGPSPCFELLPCWGRFADNSLFRKTPRAAENRAGCVPHTLLSRS